MKELKSIFTREGFQAHGLQLRDVQTRVAMDVDRVLRAPSSNEVVTFRDDERAGTQGLRNLSAVGLIEAGTGCGKTIAYAVPLLQYMQRTNQRVAVSTFTRALQRQLLLGNDLERAAALAGVTLRPGDIAVRMGRQNFVSARRVYELGSRLEVAENESWQQFQRWVESWRDDMDPLDTTFQAWQDICPTLPMIQGQELSADMFAIDDVRSSGDEDDKFYRAHAEAARSARFVITNHASLILHQRARGTVLGEDLRAIVIDEADRLPDAAIAMFTHRLRPGVVLRRCERRTGRDANPRLHEVAEQLEGVMMRIGEESGWLDMTPTTLRRERPPHDLHDLLGLLQDFELPDGCPHEQDGFKLVTSAMADAQSHAQPGNDIVYLSFSPIRRMASFCVEPVSVSRHLQRLTSSLGPEGLLFEHVILTSASLSDLSRPRGRQMDHVEHDYGVSPNSVVVRASYAPQGFGKMSFVLPDPRAGHPFGSSEDETYGGALLRVHNESCLAYWNRAIDSDRACKKLVLAAAFADVEALARQRGIENFDRTMVIDGVVFHHEADNASKIARHLQDPLVRAIVSPSFWEGWNLRGEGGRQWIQDLIILRMPIPPFPGADVKRRRVEHLMRQDHRLQSEAAAEGVLYMRSVRNALRKLLQGMGRGIRDPRDVVRVWVLDPRISLDSTWIQSLDERLPADFAERRDWAKQPSHPALEKWMRAVPTRFEGAVDAAACFTIEGEFACPVMPLCV